MKSFNQFFLIIIYLFCFNFIFLSLLFGDEVFEIEYDLNPYIYPTTGDWIYELTPRCLQITPDSGFAVLMEIELTDGMLAHFCTALLKIDSAGTVQWFKMLTDDPTLDDFDIMMQGWYFARGFTIEEDGGFVILVTGEGYGESIGSFILKLDANGEYEWHTQLSDETFPYIHFLNTIKQTSDGEFYAAGYRDYGYPIYLEIMEVVKLSIPGDTLWTRTYEGYHKAYDLELNDEECPIITAKSGSSANCLNINNEGGINWQTQVQEQFSVNISISRQNVNNCYYIGFIYFPNENIIIKEINIEGDILDEYDIPLTEYFNMYPISVDFNADFIFFTGRTEGNYDVNCTDYEGNVIWQFEKKWYGKGNEVLQRTLDGNFAVISVQNNDTLVLTKFDENGNYTDADNNNIPQPEAYLRAYPNPFNPTTTINYSLKENTKVSLNIYNIKGQLVKILIDDLHDAGEHSVIWDSRDYNQQPVGSGIYFFKLNVNGKTEAIKKCLLLK